MVQTCGELGECLDRREDPGQSVAGSLTRGRISSPCGRARSRALAQTATFRTPMESEDRLVDLRMHGAVYGWQPTELWVHEQPCSPLLPTLFAFRALLGTPRE